ncbi:restriction endonuclease subunit S [Streptococcus cuniculipharyngis]|uniref:Restriction endonuclease subunit S n=1 Tax=Streptococcus cuniculipharyngis TaxID=1562651 RepID=A0A5C5SAS9_9STRE|nr:restriction endonuclease subunit S [Streptococcus cuniculipharyngis]TWS97386.1 restriction endonuclease subunit S [Streptococcus cuniculipharyngis]
MTYIDKMIKELCPDGVEWKALGEVCVVKTGQSVNKTFIQNNSGAYPVINSGKEPLGYVDIFNTEDDPIGITSRGAGVGYVSWNEGKYFRGNLNYSATIKDSEKLLPRYLYYFLKNNSKKIEELCTFDGIPALNKFKLETLNIAIPHEDIQKEIVKILDKFTDYITELTAELTARQKQYSFYRDRLLSFEDEVYQVEWKTLRKICRKISSGGTPKSDNEDYYGGNIPWLRTQDIDFKDIVSTSATITQAGLENSSAKWVPINSVVIAMYGATAGKSAVTKIPLTTNQACCNLEIDEELANYRYVYHWVYKNYELLKARGQGSQSNISGKIIKDFPIPLPSLTIQSRIAEVLDNFDTVCNDLQIGLPKEIELRQKQYEFFRDKLLTFTAEGVYTDSTVQTRPD